MVKTQQPLNEDLVILVKNLLFFGGEYETSKTTEKCWQTKHRLHSKRGDNTFLSYVMRVLQ